MADPMEGDPHPHPHPLAPSPIKHRGADDVVVDTMLVGHAAAVAIHEELTAEEGFALQHDPPNKRPDDHHHHHHYHDEEELTAKRQKVSRTTYVAAPSNKKVNNEQWDAMFERLVAYKAQNGDCLVPKRYAADPKLGTWVETQRVQYKRLERAVDEQSGIETVAPNKRLNQERLEKLQSIGFAWSAKNVRKGGNKTLCSSSTTTGGNSSSTTSYTARPKRAAAPTTMEVGGSSSSARTARTRLNDSQWEQMYQRLVQYKEKHGDCLVPRKYEQDPKLAAWVETQRVLWNRDYRDSSSAAGGSTAGGPTNLALPEPASVPAAASLPVEGGRSVEEWAEDLNKSGASGHAHGGATAEDAAELAAITMGDGEDVVVGMMEEDDQAQTDAVVEAAAAAAAEAVDAPLDEAVKMAASAQPKRLTQERKEKLDALGFVWSLRNKRIDDHWDEMFRQLVEYKEQHGDCLVPSRYEQNLKLGKWVETQRYEYTKLQRATSGTAETKEDSDGAAQGKPRAINPRLTDERLRRLEAIGFEWKVKHKMKRYYDKQWDQMFERLLKFKEETGHCMVPKRYPPDIRLGTWVHTQRIQYRKMMAGKSKSDSGDTASDTGTDEMPLVKPEDEVSYRLTEDRRKRLEAAGFVWSARESENKGVEQGKITRNSYDDQWDSMFERLKAYKEKVGNCLVPKRYKDDPKLGTWVDTQRVQYKKMKKKLAEQGIVYQGPAELPEGVQVDATPAVSEKPVVGRLTDDRIRRLEKLGFVWSLRDDWQTHYEELKAYKQEHGHCNVPARFSKNRRLGIWVSAQRQQYKLLQGAEDSTKPRRSAPLTQERINLLNELGFNWSIRSRDSLGESWNQRLADLKEYREVHGHCNVPSRYPPNSELGVWVGTQRTQYRLYMKAKEAGEPVAGASAMNEERIRLLEEIGFIWCLRGEHNNRIAVSGGDAKKETDALDAAAIEQEAIQVAGEITAGAGVVGEVSHDGEWQMQDSIGQAQAI